LSLYFYWCLTLFFLFSSRRRHTRCLSDWSSDVCSSDLLSLFRAACGLAFPTRSFVQLLNLAPGQVIDQARQEAIDQQHPAGIARSEERRVGKECSTRWTPSPEET